MSDRTRRDFLRTSLSLGAAALAAGPLASRLARAADKPGANIAFGLVTYQWGRDWDLPTLLKNCQATQVLAVELRTTHAHGVEPSIDTKRRQEVKKRFADSPVTLVGLGTNECFHHTDRAAVEKAIENSKAFIKLGHDIGGSGVKVKPNDLPKGVPAEKTCEQIGKALNVLGAFGADYGQQIRLEVHGGCSPLPIIKQILDVADHPNVAICWNSNATDLKGEGLEHNFNLVKKRLGATCHVRELTGKDYPWLQLLTLLVQADWNGWTLLEAGSNPPDRVKALAEQRAVWEALMAKARG